MATKRMFSLQVVDTDRFLDMSASAQALYFHLGMHGDDDGFVSSPKRIARAVGCNDDDLRLLAAKGFVIPFDSGVVVITDWSINNTLKNDRYRPTIYQNEKSQIEKDKGGKYVLISGVVPECFQNDSSLEPERNLTERSITERSITEHNKSEEADKPPLPSPVETVSGPPVFTIPLNDGSDYPIFEAQVQEWADLYPSVDIMQQLRNMKGWLSGNKTRRKTKRGILKFITGWLAREQDRGGHYSGNGFAGTSKPKKTFEEIAREMEANGEL